MENLFEFNGIKKEDVVIKLISVSDKSDDTLCNMEKQIDGIEFVHSESIKDNIEIRNTLENADLIFLIGEHNDKLNSLAEIAAELNVLAIAVVTDQLASEVTPNCTKLVCHINNDDSEPNVLLQSVKNITDLITYAGMIGIDVSDIGEVVKTSVMSIISTGSATGENRAKEAVAKAISSPLFQNAILKKEVKGILIGIAAANMEFFEFTDIGDFIAEFASSDCVIKIGMLVKKNLGNEIVVTVIFTD